MPTVRAHDRTGRRAGLSGALRGAGLDAKPGRAGRMVPAMERRVSGQMERRMQSKHRHRHPRDADTGSGTYHLAALGGLY